MKKFRNFIFWFSILCFVLVILSHLVWKDLENTIFWGIMALWNYITYQHADN